MLYWNTPPSSISNLVLYPQSSLGGKIIFVLGSIWFNRESIGIRFLHPLLYYSSSYPNLGLGIYCPDITTTIKTMLPAAIPTPDIAPVSDESQYTGRWCSGGVGHMYPPTLSPPPPLLRPEVGIPTAPACLTLDVFPPYGGPLSGGILRGSSQSWGLSPRSQRQKVGSSELIPSKKCQISRGLTCTAPKS